MLKELLLSSILSLSASVRTSNDVTQPLDYEFMTKLENIDGNFTYNIKRDWEREFGIKYIDNVGSFQYKSPSNAYCGVDWVDKNSKDIHYITYNLGLSHRSGLKVGLSVKEDAPLLNVGFGSKFKKDNLEYNINISIKSDFDENSIFNIKSDIKKWITEKINIFALYKHEYYNEKQDFQFKAGIGVKI